MSVAESTRACQWVEALLSKNERPRDWIRHFIAAVPQLEAFLNSKPKERAERIRGWPSALRNELKPYLDDSLWERRSSQFISFLHPFFPKALHELADPPCGLYFSGDLSLLCRARPWLGVVGTRRASGYALKTCREWIREMQPYQPVIVSGMASGVDAAAHAVALDVALPSIGVLGTPIDRIYPRENAKLFARMRVGGLLLSEMPATAELGPWRFPERNRLIAALSDALWVVEAPRPSGALLTADFALDLGREIFVLPGWIGEQNAGGHRLIQQGAHLLAGPLEIFRRLGCRRKISKAQTELFHSAVPSWSPEESRVLQALKCGRAQIDKIAYLSQLPHSQLCGTLMALQLRNAIVEWPGKIFEINSDFNGLAV